MVTSASVIVRRHVTSSCIPLQAIQFFTKRKSVTLMKHSVNPCMNSLARGASAPPREILKWALSRYPPSAAAQHDNSPTCIHYIWAISYFAQPSVASITTIPCGMCRLTQFVVIVILLIGGAAHNHIHHLHTGPLTSRRWRKVIVLQKRRQRRRLLP